MPNRSKFEGQFVEETHGYGTPYSREGTRVRQAERQQTFAKSVANYSETVHPSEETLSGKERVFRVEVVETFL